MSGMLSPYISITTVNPPINYNQESIGLYTMYSS